MNRGVFARGCLVAALVIGFSCGVWALPQQPESNPIDSADIPSQAPLNPEFVQYQKAVAQGQAPVVMTADGYSLGHVPAPLDLSHLTAQVPQQITNSLPSSYDLRNYSRVTPVRNQGQCGSCWTFGTFGSLESILRTGETWDFSENNLKNLHGFDYSPCSGGNGTMSMAYMTRWGGPVNESDDPYQPTDVNTTSPTGLSPQKHVQNVLILPGRGGALTNDTLKNADMTYGAVHTSMTWDDPSYKAGTASYYYSGSAALNHDVTLVGWDDNYSAANFNTPPAGNGAFLIKNSWGSGWGQSGYFWISYYDTKYAFSAQSYVWLSEPTANYTRQYSYDPLGWVSGLGYPPSNTGWFANIFTATASESLTAVATYAGSDNTTYSVTIRTGVSGSPSSGTPAGSASGTFVNAGYHTVVLPSPVPLISGQAFSVIMQLTTPGYTYPVPVEYAATGYSSAATASPGQSYFSSSGSSWTDATTWKSTANVALKAFTGGGFSNPAPWASSLSPASATAGGTAFTLTVNGSNFVNGSTVQWNGNNRTTTFVNSTQLTTVISAADIATAGTASVTVFTPAPGGGTSNALSFTIPSSVGIDRRHLPNRQPRRALSALALAFDTETVGQSAAEQVVIVSNSGNAPLTISAIQTTGDFRQRNDCGIELAAGRSCTITVQFAPTAAGLHIGELLIRDSAPYGPATVRLSGTAASPVQPASDKRRDLTTQPSSQRELRSPADFSEIVWLPVPLLQPAAESDKDESPSEKDAARDKDSATERTTPNH
jgi:C1A family cysteine protease